MFVIVQKKHQASNEPGWIDEDEQDPFIFQKGQVVQVVDEVEPEDDRSYKIITLKGIRYVDKRYCSIPRPTRGEAESASSSYERRET